MTIRRLTGPALERLRGADVTYPEVGATAGELPAGYHHLRRTARVGDGADSLLAASRVVSAWRMHEGAGFRVLSEADTAEDGSVVLLRLGPGPVSVRVPCRVVYVVDEPDRQGFAYGTLPGHPEIGEESFVLRRHADGAVDLEIIAFSRPATTLARIAGPVGRWLQRRMTDRYLRAVRRRLR